MAVVINEFEVVSGPAAPDAPAAKAEPKPDHPAVDPRELERILRKHAHRAARVRAH